MKNVILGASIIAAIGLVSCKNDSKKAQHQVNDVPTEKSVITNVTFGVRGNCGMCKKTIEKAALATSGVSKANWDVEKKSINVSYDSSHTSEMSIHNSIAAAGYDTKMVEANTEAYSNLPGCCQYDHKMVLSDATHTTNEHH